MQNIFSEPIIAVATGNSNAAIAIIRMSGNKAISIGLEKFSLGKTGKKIAQIVFNKMYYGEIVDNNSQTLDEVMLVCFDKGKSYTGEEMVEIYCHGSSYIIENIVQLYLSAGIKLATAGEFTMRSFLNGKIDLSQAEAVADLIASNTKHSHAIAIKQLKGNVSKELENLREQLINFASLIELELDFSEEDVEFANRTQLQTLVDEIIVQLSTMLKSFVLGNSIKNGVQVVIAGKPNVGKSTLLNCLLNEERAIVSSIAGTTRDTIEDTINIEGILFRFADTAGLRVTNDEIESIGIQKTYNKIEQSTIVLYLIEPSLYSTEYLNSILNDERYSSKIVLFVINKIDKENISIQNAQNTIAISAKEKINIEALKAQLLNLVNFKELNNNTIILNNARHVHAIEKALDSLYSVKSGIKNKTTSDLLAFELKSAMNYIGEISGKIHNDNLLDNIFSKFCIGK
jgi:tRNA modification GTPase